MSQRRNLMQELWNEFRPLVYPPETPEIQLKECRRAFYAGAHGLFGKILMGLSPDHDPTDADMQLLSDLQDELDDFAKAIQKGAA